MSAGVCFEDTMDARKAQGWPNSPEGTKLKEWEVYKIERAREGREEHHGECARAHE